ncbi:MAG: hypothetical protein J0H34_03815 [Rhizobiales bacterium]|nr:hypothetical protein [Hyphomicrobiales bacterium]
MSDESGANTGPVVADPSAPAASQGFRSAVGASAAVPRGGISVPAKVDLADPEPTPAEDIKKESSPFSDGDRRVMVYAWMGFLLRILLVVGAVFSLVQYLAAREEKRVERTLELVDMWDGKDFQDAQSALKARLVALNEANEGLMSSNPSEDERRIYYESVGKQLMTDAGGTMPLQEFEPKFDRIVYFLNRVSTCVRRNLCDREVADDYFLDYARSFWSYFSGYAQSMRKNGSANYAKAIEEYVATAPKAAGPATEP